MKRNKTRIPAQVSQPDMQIKASQTDVRVKTKQMDIRAKAIVFIGFMLLTFIFNDPRFLTVLLLGACGFAVLCRLPLVRFTQALLPLFPLLVLILAVTSFNLSHTTFQLDSSRPVICSFGLNGRWAITQGGLGLGLTYAIRILIFVLASLIIQTTTSLVDLYELFQWARLPNELSFLLMAALRFIPVLNKKRLQISEAQKARGSFSQENGSLLSIRSFLPIVIPLFANSIQMAETLSMSMVSRGFGYTKTWTPGRELRFKSSDYVIIAITMGLVIFAFYLRIMKQGGCL